MKSFLTLSLALMLTGICAQAETHVPAGPVSGTWTLAGSPYYIEGDVYIEATSSLTIQPGVQVIMNPNRRFRILGQLQAVGTQADSIRFLAADTSLGSEGLHFLNTNQSSQDSSRLDYCVVSYGVGTGYPDPYMHGGGLYISNSSRLRISHCYIHHCRTVDVVGANGANGVGSQGGYGNPGSPGSGIQAGHGGAIYIDGCSPILSYNELAFNHTGEGRGGNGGAGAFVWDMGGWPPHGGTGGTGGYGTGGDGGAIFMNNSAAILFGNVMHHNYTGNGYGGRGGDGGDAIGDSEDAYGGYGAPGGQGSAGTGGAICFNGSQVQASNNMIYFNYLGTGTGGNGGDGGGAGGYYVNPTPGGGGAGGNGFGGNGYALYADFSADNVNCCTFTQQFIISEGHGGIGGWDGDHVSQAAPGQGLNGAGVITGATLTVTNSIIWNNITSSINPSAAVSYSCVAGGHAGIGNISTDPLFVNPSQQNFFLSQIAAGQAQQSPCVDHGNPASPMITGTTRTDGVQDAGIVDMGYHYPGVQTLPQITLNLTSHNPPIQIPPGGGSFQLDVTLNWNQYFNVPIDVWTQILFPDSSIMTALQRPNITLAPGGGTISRNNLTQFIPAGAPSGTYGYFGYVRNHITWQTLTWDSFAFVKQPGEALPAHNLGWSVLGWEGEEAFSSQPSALSLLGVHPNPFNATTVASFELRVPSHVSLKVYDTAGRLVTTLVDGWRGTGTHEVTFNGSKLTSGVYFVQMQSENSTAISKIVLLK